jgi:hypothetical protein
MSLVIEGEHLHRLCLMCNPIGYCIIKSMVIVLTSSVVVRGFDPWSGQTKDYRICISCFSAKHAVLRRKGKDWFVSESEKCDRVGRHVYPRTVATNFTYLLAMQTTNTNNTNNNQCFSLEYVPVLIYSPRFSVVFVLLHLWFYVYALQIVDFHLFIFFWHCIVYWLSRYWLQITVFTFGLE